MSWTVNYQQRRQLKNSDELSSEEAAFEFVDELENEVGGYANSIWEDDNLRYIRHVSGTDVWWLNVENALQFE